jgi:two-component system, LytTR family, response regulator
MITAVIIDDEQNGRLALREKLKLFCPEVEVLAEAENGKLGLEIIKKYKPEIIFLDVEMPEMNGFEMLTQLSERKAHVIFTTAYDQYAIKAIKYAAFDYLLKPIDIEELKLTVKKAWDNDLQEERKKIITTGKSFTKLAIATVDGLHFIPIADIIRLEADSNYTTFYLQNGTKFLSSRSLIDYEELLNDHNFFRCHHSHIINLNFVSKYIKNDGGEIVMSDGTHVDISRRKKKEFLFKVAGKNDQ